MKASYRLLFVLLSVSGIWMSGPLTTAYPQQISGPDVATYPADVLTDWLALQLRITQTTPAAPPVAIRRLAYTGVALYEALAPGMTAYQSIAPTLNGLPALPAITPGVTYHWPACANATLASIIRALYPMTSPKNKAAIDSLEAAQVSLYERNSSKEELTRSADFGKKIAAAVFEWAKTDGYDNSTPYTLPTGTGKYVLTPPNFLPAALCNWGQCRPLVSGSDAGTDKNPPVAYSEDPASAYYAQVKEVYDVSQHLTPEQKAIALFWADDPDGSSFGGAHWTAILHQVLVIQKPRLDAAARAYAQLGITCAEATFCVFKGKYKYNGLRPITYIRTVMNQPGWNTLIVTPPHPEYPSGHALISGAAAQTLSQLFGDRYAFTDSCYTFRGYGPRTYSSFGQAAQEAADSRVYGGIHYHPSCNASLVDGRIIARNVAQTLRFTR